MAISPSAQCNETVEKQLSYFPVLLRTHNVYGCIRLTWYVFKMIFVSMMVRPEG